jgi:hypothetical protein
MVTASKVAELIRAYKPDNVFIDETGGYGAAVIDRLRQLNIPCIAIQFGSRADEEKQFANKRAEMWARMKEWIFREGDDSARGKAARGHHHARLRPREKDRAIAHGKQGFHPFQGLRVA